MLSVGGYGPLLVSNQPWRVRLEEALADLPANSSPDRLHEFREALARLMVWLRLSGDEPFRGRLRAIRRQVGVVRDLDVIREQASKEEATQLDRKSEQQREELMRTLSTRRMRELVDALRQAPPLNQVEAKIAAKRLWKRVRTAGRELERHPTLETAHRLRRRLREYRFAREWLHQKTRRYRPLLKELGRLNDERLLADFHEKSGLNRSGVSDNLAARLETCVELWRALRFKSG
jgi:CHAD domain-containing protein